MFASRIEKNEAMDFFGQARARLLEVTGLDPLINEPKDLVWDRLELGSIIFGIN